MISDAELRGIVELLRDEADYWRDYHKGEDTSCMSDSDFTESILEAFGFDGAEVPVCELFDKLADLIDRPTTTRHGKFKTKYGGETPCCELCGYSIGDMRWSYCPKCGAEVVE